MKRTREDWRQRDGRIRLEPDVEQRGMGSGRTGEGARLTREGRRVLWCGGALAVAFVLSVLLVGNLFNGDFSLAWVARYALRRCGDILDLLTGARLQSGIHFFLCQFACPVLAGAALAVSGACFQAVFHNPMASPTLLGVESGGALGATVYLLFCYTPSLAGLLDVSYEGYALEYHAMTIWQKYGQYFMTFAGCVAVVAAVLLLTKLSGRGRIATVPLMVGGTVFTTCISTLVTAAQYYEAIRGGDTMVIAQVQAIQSGSFQNISTPALLLCLAVLVLIPMAVLMLMCGRLNLIAFGEEEARMMGVDLGLERTVIVLLSTVMTAAVVAFCGAISFVGLIVPHLARHVAGNDFRRLTPACAFLGGLFLLLAFDLSYMLNYVVNAGLIVNVAGGGIFLISMIRYRRRGHADRP